MVLGSNRYILKGRGRVVALRMRGRNMVTLDLSNDGVLLDASVFSEDGRVVAEIVKNRFTVNTNNSFKIERPEHGLVVFDQMNRRVLDVLFQNHSAVQISGRLSDGRDELRIENGKMMVGGGTFWNSESQVAVEDGDVLLDFTDDYIDLGNGIRISNSLRK